MCCRIGSRVDEAVANPNRPSARDHLVRHGAVRWFRCGHYGDGGCGAAQQRSGPVLLFTSAKSVGVRAVRTSADAGR